SYLEAPSGDQTVLLLYTSGTTGDPKGVMLTMGNLMSNINTIVKFGLFHDYDRALALLPLHHVLPLMGSLMAPLYVGATVVIVDDLSSNGIKTALQKHKITLFVGVPRLWEMFHKGIMDKINSSFIARILFKLVALTNSKKLGKKIFKKVQDGFGGEMYIMVSGGAKIDPQIIQDFKTLGFSLVEGFGLTETSPMLTLTYPDDIVPGSCGVPLEGVEVKINPDREVVVRGANVMKGYYNKPEATAEAIDNEGWFHTGDLGEFKGGHLFIIGRKKEMIVLPNGKNINPLDIENILISKTNIIQEVAVTEYKNHLVAIIYPNLSLVQKEGIKNINEKIKWDIIDKYNLDAPNYKKILDFKIISEELPKTKLGKVRRFMLNDLLEEKDKKVVVLEEPAFLEYSLLKDFISTLKGSTPHSTDHFELDLGLDSLDFVELLSFIGNRFNITLLEDEINNYPNLLELSTFLHDKGVEITEKETDWNDILNKDIDIFIPKSSSTLMFSRSLFSLFFKTYIKIEKSGLENLTNRGSIFIGNHQSMLDAFMLQHVLEKDTLKKTYFLSIEKHFKSDFRKWVGERGNVILLNEKAGVTETLQTAAMVLRQGKSLVIFPEGARSRDGQMKKFKKAFAILSKTLDIPIQPFVIDGAYKAMPSGRVFPISCRVKLKFLPIIETKNMDINEIVTMSEISIQEALKTI
ncbi:MAG: AMP-binding protein, partial [Psychrilyobacter sp.]|nr:AMP-binding protein [Psychrilyobacter sp.]